jgi:hypothetical protein
MGEETEVSYRGEIHRRRDGGKETEGADLWEGQRGTCKRGEREEGWGEEVKGKRKGKGREEVDTGETQRRRNIREVEGSDREETDRGEETQRRGEGEEAEEKRQRRRDRGEETEM